MNHASTLSPMTSISSYDHLHSTLATIRGGSHPPSVADTINSAYIKSAISYFNNLRVPAAVLMSIIMKEMFALQATPPSAMRAWDTENGIDKSKRWRTLRYTYLLLMVLAFSLETNTIFVATQVLTQLATAQRVAGRQEQMLNVGADSDMIGGLFSMRKEVTASMVDFLLKNFEFEYCTVRFHFVTGLLSFALAQALRVRYALRKYEALSMSGMCCLLTVASGMLTYTNANTITYGGYVNLMKRQFQLSINFLMTRAKSGPMSAVTFLFACLTIIYAIKGWISPEFAYFDSDWDDNRRALWRFR
mmetsp:Transcript_15444/g.31347  ORF Transcript_15444/g.31347 Transcript_15444/m.31347 type:complete len:304 (+) Transcript_15444:1-912(+)